MSHCKLTLPDLQLQLSTFSCSKLFLFHSMTNLLFAVSRMLFGWCGFSSSSTPASLDPTFCACQQKREQHSSFVAVLTPIPWKVAIFLYSSSPSQTFNQSLWWSEYVFQLSSSRMKSNAEVTNLTTNFTISGNFLCIALKEQVPSHFTTV